MWFLPSVLKLKVKKLRTGIKLMRAIKSKSRHGLVSSELHMRPDFRTMTYWNPKCPIDLHLSGHLTYCFAVQTVTFTMSFTCSWTPCPITFTCPGHYDLLRKETVWSSVSLWGPVHWCALVDYLEYSWMEEGYHLRKILRQEGREWRMVNERSRIGSNIKFVTF